MPIRHRARCAYVLAAFVLCGVQMPAQSPSPLPYGIANLGLTQGTNSAAYDVGEYGQVVVGRSRSTSGAYHAFADGYFGLRDLGTSHPRRCRAARLRRRPST